ncbi:MAG TPA: shikimate dehydrogenase [Mycobacteriales bacterium]|nr:shikimate dehydrogenase [Mycobacteriales bacterium]
MTGRRRAAVLGKPIAHSLSPVLHRAAYAALGLDWDYALVECDEAGLPAFLAGLGDEWAGLSLTMPLKKAVLPLLDEVSPLARQVGAANTVLFPDGARHGARRGDNTDVPGMVAALRDRGVHSVHRALVLGAGATAASALAALREVGEYEPRVAVRDPARARDLLAAAERLGVRPHLVPWHTADPRDADLVLATTPAGVADALADAPWPPGTALFDVVYAPWPTRAASAASSASAVVVGGLDLLVQQAALQVTLMTGRPAPLAAMRAAGERAVAGAG